MAFVTLLVAAPLLGPGPALPQDLQFLAPLHPKVTVLRVQEGLQAQLESAIADERDALERYYEDHEIVKAIRRRIVSIKKRLETEPPGPQSRPDGKYRIDFTFSTEAVLRLMKGRVQAPLSAQGPLIAFTLKSGTTGFLMSQGKGCHMDVFESLRLAR